MEYIGIVIGVAAVITVGVKLYLKWKKQKDIPSVATERNNVLAVKNEMQAFLKII